MESLLPILISLASGAVGGNAAGTVMKNLSLGTLGNSIVGILGGGLGGQLLGMLGVGIGGDGMDMSSIVGNVASSGVGGGVLLAIVGLIRKALAR